MRMHAALDRAIIVLAVGLAAAEPAHASQVSPDTLEEVQRAASDGDFARGLGLARAASDPLTALRAEVWLMYRAREFDAAYAAAERGLNLAPDDLWLAERACASALWLRDPTRAQAALGRFTAIANAAKPGWGEAFGDPLTQARVATAELVAGSDRARAAKLRARSCSLAILAVVLMLLAWCGLGLRKASP